MPSTVFALSSNQNQNHQQQIENDNNHHPHLLLVTKPYKQEHQTKAAAACADNSSSSDDDLASSLNSNNSSTKQQEDYHLLKIVQTELSRHLMRHEKLLIPFSYFESEYLSSASSKVENIGKGAFSSVFSITTNSNNDNNSFALKVVNTNPQSFPNTSGEKPSIEYIVQKFAEEVKYQVRCSSSSTSSNVTKILGVTIIPSNKMQQHFNGVKTQEEEGEFPHLAIMMEKADSTFFDLLYKQLNVHKERFTIDTILSFSLQIASGLSSLHKSGIVHADLKPANILVFSMENVTNDDKNQTTTTTTLIKLSDFGAARSLPSSTQNDTSTDDDNNSSSNTNNNNNNNNQNISNSSLFFWSEEYVAPENFTRRGFGKSFNPSFDVFSFGVILYQMISLEFHLWSQEEVGRMIYTNNSFTSSSSSSSSSYPFYSMLQLATQSQVNRAIRKQQQEQGQEQQKEFISSSPRNNNTNRCDVPSALELGNSLVKKMNKFKPEFNRLLNLCERCLALNPNDRPKDGEDLLKEIQSICCDDDGKQI